MKKLVIFFSLLNLGYAHAQSCIGDCQNGKGRYEFVTGAVYMGTWKNGKRSGYGETTSSNGEQYKGNYEND